MSKTKATKARKRSKTAKPAPKRLPKQVDLGGVRDQITRLVGNRATKLVETTMGEVNKGHYLAMKYLFEMVGLFPATTPEAPLQDDSLAKTLLRRLKLPEEIIPGTEVTAECVIEPVEREGDNVK
jgi:hypothetical protein